MKDQKPCIFCGEYGNKSKEHIYPDWLSKHIDTVGVHNTATVLTQHGNSPKELTSQSKRQGHLITKKIRAVCQSCNNGWMSQIENAAKPILISGISNSNLLLNREQQLALARWVFLKTIVCEHSNSQLASTPFIDRHAFCLDQSMPNYFRIYFGAHSTTSVVWYYRHSATISFSQTVQPPLLDGLQRNIQSTTFILGNFLFHVLAARVEGFRADVDISYPGLTSLWPMRKDFINTNELKLLTSIQTSVIVSSLETYLTHRNPTHISAVI